MSETLLIRLASMADEPIHWLVWSNSENEIIASGELANAEQLSELSDKARQRQVIALVPSSDISMQSLKVPGKSKRAIQMAAPYMLEDDLAQEVEQLFFAYHDVKTDEENNCSLAAVERQQLEQWQTWLSDANIPCQQMIPDALALPHHEESWSCIKLGEQFLLKQGQWQATNIDQQIWPFVCQQWLNNATDEEKIIIHSYADLPATEGLEIVQQPEELPMALLAQQVSKIKFNLLQGEFQIKVKRNANHTGWLIAAGIAVFALLLNVIYKGGQLYQLNNQQSVLEDKIVTLYKQTFPQSKKVRISTIRSQLKQKISGIDTNTDNAHFLQLLNRLEPAFARVPQLKPESLKYDHKRQEIRLQAIASSYQQFEQFKNQLEQLKLTVAQGSQNNQGDQVTGSFSIKG